MSRARDLKHLGKNCPLPLETSRDPRPTLRNGIREEKIALPKPKKHDETHTDLQRTLAKRPRLVGTVPPKISGHNSMERAKNSFPTRKETPKTKAIYTIDTDKPPEATDSRKGRAESAIGEGDRSNSKLKSL